MNGDLIKIGEVQPYLSASGRHIMKYTVDIYHAGLKEHKILSAPDNEMLDNILKIQKLKWKEKWDIIEKKEASVEEAKKKTEEAVSRINELNNILIDSYANTTEFDISKYKQQFLKNPPNKPIPEKKKIYPEKPEKEKIEYDFLESMFKFLRDEKNYEYEKKYNLLLDKWKKEVESIDDYNNKKEKEYLEAIRKWENEYANWELEKEEYYEKNAYNKKIKELYELYIKGDVDAIVEFFDLIIDNSVYPEAFQKKYYIDYNPENKILIIEYQLPPLSLFPKIKEVKYIATKKELKEQYYSESYIDKLFDDAIYKITLKIIHEIFTSDVVDVLDAISFNGWVKAINKATGKEENNCILTILVKKNIFKEINLINVDPKICFKNLKGIASSKLSSLTPIQPILQISRNDKRFVESYNVASTIDNATNIAAMDWQDFEHLIRELFEKEFQENGGEVKITQASRDGGVDAIAFDPDPIRGGKIVIQAKRYTNTVGVSAVRDLYGTIMNEGAMKGILVSTADYGPDAYEFAKDKPITLFSGANLLHLLEKHGHHAKIDLKEAKKLLGE